MHATYSDTLACQLRHTELVQYLCGVCQTHKPTANNAQAAWLGGTTLLIDQPHPAYPDNMGYWSELLLPLFSMLSSSEWKQQGVHIDNILFANMNRDQLEVCIGVAFCMQLL